MAIKREDFSDKRWGELLQDRWDRLQGLVDSGQLDAHPLVADFNTHSKLLRDARSAKDGGNDPGDQPSVGDPNAQDDDPPANATTRGVTGGPREGNRISEDSATVAARLRSWGLSERRVREIMARSTVSAADRAAVAALIPGYDRLR